MFSALDSLSFGWHALQKHLGKAVGMVAVYFVCLALLTGVSVVAEMFFMPEDSLGVTFMKLGLYVLFQVLINVVAIALSLGWIKASIGFAEGKPSWQDISAGLRIWPVLSYFLGQLIYNLVVFVGILPIVILFGLFGYLLGNAGIGAVVGFIAAIPVMGYVMLEFMLFPFFIVDKNAGPIKALQDSSKLCRGKKWSLLGFILLSVLINLGGLLAFGIGLLITMPWTWIATAHAYTTLRDTRLNIY